MAFLHKVFIHTSLHFSLGVWFLMFLKILSTSELIIFQINFKHFHYYQILSINFCGWYIKIQLIVLTINIQKYSCILTLLPGTLVNSFNSNNLPVDSTIFLINKSCYLWISFISFFSIHITVMSLAFKYEYPIAVLISRGKLSKFHWEILSTGFL